MSDHEHGRRPGRESGRDEHDASEQLDAARDHTEAAAHHMKEAARHSGEAMKAGAGGTAEMASDTGRAVGRTVKNAARGTAHTAADAGKAAGRAAGRVVKGAAGIVGGPVKAAVNAVASKVGGWWDSARDRAPSLPDSEVEACLVHYELHIIETEELSFDDALTAYALGYIAAHNPAYAREGFESAESDLAHGFEDEDVLSQERWRDFSRFGYERGRMF
jgi:hypothetical protein